ncbi:glycoside hydrolase family 9 protein [Arthrospiribacter ruber]|uniref:Cellulase n=1 Tax=Arthrospiribacter ruber TaxID=2487934 RepID=A0A951IWI3_9BACT|nr:glycoside hydrolase family 9 protein [Arthrospiribacter ruber]MBW3468208.1 cellulase [Arthrospiribacter ruber]
MKAIYFQLVLLSAIFYSCNKNQGTLETKVSPEIRVNQLGYFPDETKKAVITGLSDANDFSIVEIKSNQKVFQGELSAEIKTTFSDKTVRHADFSTFRNEGEFCVFVKGLGCSPPFGISNGIIKELGKASLKAFYFQRASTDLPEQYAGIWARNAGHPDDRIFVHASAANSERQENEIISAPFGWYDAGDYNKYIVNSGITMGTLLSLFEDFPEFSKNLDLEIPESGNEIPDILDELLWNLKWMSAMQDPDDGGVYHKLTTADFEGMVLPEYAVNKRYVVAKSTAAALDFAAVMAQSARVFKDFYPNLEKEYLNAAELAWNWALENPEVYYKQNEMNNQFSPAINTGAYGDNQLKDEWIWAAAELYISTQNPDYLKKIEIPKEFELPSWSKVSWLGYYSLIRKQDELPNLQKSLLDAIKRTLINQADQYVDFAANNAYLTSMGSSEKDYVWGSNSVASNQGIALVQAYKLTGEEKYLETAIGNINYILGKNATGYSYVTGFGFQTPMRPHHRLAEAEPEKAPLPGFMVGGPNPSQQDACNYISNLPDESFVDEACSYASNEIAINWNAAFAYFINAVNFLKEA